MGHFGKAWKGDVYGNKFHPAGSASTGIGNARVKNATKVISADGTKFDSKLELYMDQLIRTSGIKYERQYVFELQPGFVDPFSQRTICNIKWVVDFYFPDLGIIVETKGFATEKFELKFKMFQYGVYCHRFPGVRQVKFAKNQNECLLIYGELLHEQKKVELSDPESQI